MLIKRVKTLRRIGGFRDFSGGGSVPFADQHNITVVFGRNTHGKSTLADILHSLGQGDPSLLDGRESIPKDSSKSRLAELTYSSDNGGEKTAKLTSSWSSNDLTGNIHVFGQEFVHKNVMAGGSTITRENREYFTDFILGEQGVVLSNKIEQLKKDLRQQKSTLVDLRPPTVAGLSFTNAEVEGYVRTAPTASEPELRKEIETKEKNINRLTRAKEFLHLPSPPLEISSVLVEVQQLIGATTNTLESGYKDVTDAVHDQLQKHIDENCKSSEGAVAWLKTGHKLSGSDTCPFCGTGIANWNHALIDSYGKMFNQEFERHDARIKIEIAEQSETVNRIFAANTPAEVQKVIEILEKYEPFVGGLEEEISGLNDLVADLLSFQDKLVTELTKWHGQITVLQASKQQSPHKVITKAFSESALEAAGKALEVSRTKANQLIVLATKRITDVKTPLATYTADQINMQRQKHEGGLEESNRKLSRLLEDKQCQKYLNALVNITATEKTVAAANVDFERDQSEYLEKYFSELNRLFTELGSGDFTINAVSPKTGDKRVYALQVLFKGERIPAEQIGKTLSESDKRSLALSLFVTKLNSLADKEKQIIVLDDPAVSFDDNRIDASCALFKRLARGFGQLIIITHYKSVVTKLVRSRANATFVEVHKDSHSSVLRAYNAEAASMGPHEHAYEKICEHIDNGGSTAEGRDLRPFMEEHVRLVLQKQINDNDLAGKSLVGLIDGLFTNGVISADIKDKLHDFREIFNSDHHTSDDDFNPAEWCANAQHLVDFLYYELHASTPAVRV